MGGGPLGQDVGDAPHHLRRPLGVAALKTFAHCSHAWLRNEADAPDRGFAEGESSAYELQREVWDHAPELADGVSRTSFRRVADRVSVHGAEALPLYVLVVFMDREVDVVMDIDTDDEEALGALGVAEGGEPRAAQLPLHQFLRLIAGGRLVVPPAARSNDALLDALRRGGTLTDARVTRAMRLVRRDAFVPGAQRDEALVDAPIRLESLGFNIS
ncbi:hypothetical protein H632_c3089p0, partial [Helicosporidium sp. ATCC 50920]